ncbi:MAG TPA: helix-turn-helix domain-containing protein [Chloroflexia bacterium]|nr:helix-turn-helix domain-containing protein [Chloroflexia bacterium]
MLGERLRQLRKWREMTQTRLAQVSGIAQNYISELESGVATNPSPDMIRRLARALGVAEAELTAPLVSAPSIPADLPDPLLATPSPTEQPPVTEPEPPQGVRERYYRGYRNMVPDGRGGTYCEAVAVRVNGHPLVAHFRDSVSVEWGYLGAGPRALAYDILSYEFGDSITRHHQHAFLEQVIARWPTYVSKEPGFHLEWTITRTELHAWMAQQPRPRPIVVQVPIDAWVAQTKGRPRATVYAEFLPGHRLAVEVILDEYGYREPISAVEQELRTGAEPWLLWHYVRDVDLSELYLTRPYDTRFEAPI